MSKTQDTELSLAKEPSLRKPELIEIRNETRECILASACRSKLSGQLYIHIGKAHGNEVVVKPLHYAIIEVHEVEF